MILENTRTDGHDHSVPTQNQYMERTSANVILRGQTIPWATNASSNRQKESVQLSLVTVSVTWDEKCTENCGRILLIERRRKIMDWTSIIHNSLQPLNSLNFFVDNKRGLCFYPF